MSDSGEDTILDILEAFTAASPSGRTAIQEAASVAEIKTSGSFEKTLALLKHANLKIQQLSLRLLGKLLLSNTGFTDDFAVLENLYFVLAQGDSRISIDVCYIIANLATDGIHITSRILSLGFLPKLLRVLRVHSDLQAKIEACHAICNLAKHADTDTRIMKSVVFSTPIIPPLTEFLTAISTQPGFDKVVEVILATIVLLYQKEKTVAKQIQEQGGIQLKDYANTIFS